MFVFHVFQIIQMVPKRVTHHIEWSDLDQVTDVNLKVGSSHCFYLLQWIRSLQMRKNTINFMLKALSVFEILTFLSWYFSYLEKRFDKKSKFSFKIFDTTYLTANYYDAHIPQYLKKEQLPVNEICSVNRVYYGKYLS